MTLSSRIIVGFPVPGKDADPRTIVAAARDAAEAVAEGFGALLLPELLPGVDSTTPGLDPSILAGLLSAYDTAPRIIVEARTSRHAPFNLARRTQTLNRLSGGRVGLFLRDTGVDPVTAASGTVQEHAGLSTEYAEVLERLWSSFPEDALIGDREAGRLADPARLVPPSFVGDVYSVAGALNVPLPPEHRAVVLTEDSGSIRGFRAVTWTPNGTGGPGQLSGDPARVAAALQEGTTTAGWLLRVDVPAGQLTGKLWELGAALGGAEASNDGTIREWLSEITDGATNQDFNSRELHAHAR
ncbi:hypothetical protein [Paenarthrobacter sp. NPDC058040]|uniref:hypothetical protein n=1 Tax=unclassified Paenarthrobacter TaxID=2634190 RepID=UPI0036DEE755